MIEIIILVYNQLPYTRLCIEYFQKYTEDPHFILVNNGSNDETTQYLRTVPNSTLIENSMNIGCAAGWNQGIKVSKSEFIVIAGSDTITSPEWYPKLKAFMDSEPDLAMVGGCDLPAFTRIEGENIHRYISTWDEEFKKLNSNTTYEDLQKCIREVFGEDYEEAAREIVIVGKDHRVDSTAYGTTLIRKQLYRDVGLFDTGYDTAMVEDSDMLKRMELDGRWKMASVGCVFHHHFMGRTTSSVPAHDFYHRNLDRFNKKFENNEWKKEVEYL